MTHRSLLLFFLGFSLLFFADGRGVDKCCGYYQRISNLKDPYVVGIAQYAVSEYDKRSGVNLKLKSVVKGESQVVAGTNYRLVLATLDGSETKNFEAIVYDRPWDAFRNLTSFKPVKIK